MHFMRDAMNHAFVNECRLCQNATTTRDVRNVNHISTSRLLDCQLR